ncbi:MAG: response regulator [Nitrospinaceae bacterium]|nr:MAG: response regulator [Nitrospinaceae bacterium]
MASKILVVDDSITIQKIVGMAFDNEDASVEGVGNGSEALVKLKQFKPDVVLADVNMPGLNGFELSQKIKRSSEFNSVFVLLLTSDFEDFDEDLFRDSLADDHITKPFKSEDIVLKVKELLSQTDDFQPTEEDEAENVIKLSPTDQLEEETVVELGKDQLTNSPEENSPEEEEVQLELSDDDMMILLEDPEPDELVVGVEEKQDKTADEDPASEDDSIDTTDSSDDAPVEPVKGTVVSEKKVPEESLEELIRRVEALSKKSDEIREQSAEEELQPMEALDEMIKEVTALKKNSSNGNEEGNGIAKTSLPMDTAEMDTMVAEVNYLSEENAEELEAAFNEIIRGSMNLPSPSTEESMEQSADLPEAAETAPESGTLVEDLQAHPFATAEEADTATEKSFENIGEFQSSQEELLSQMMGKEVGEIIEQPLTPEMEKEIARLSKKITQSVETIVREIVPGIARSMIKKEIDRIKNKENG